MRKQQFLLTIQNNTTGTIPLTVLDGFNNSDIINARTRYRWDVTTASFSNPVFSIQARNALASVFQTYAGTASSIGALVTALNAIGIGTFWTVNVGPNTYLETYNDNMVYADLVVGTATSNITWSNTAPTCDILVNANSIPIITSLAPPQNGVVVVNSGDNIDGNYIFGPGAGNFLIQRILKVAPFTVTTIYTDSGSNFGSLIPPFVIDTNYNYTITMVP